MRLINNMYQLDCRLFRQVNRYFNHQNLNRFLRIITHFGGARFTIFTTILLIMITSGSVQFIVISSAISLAVSHIPVAIAKKFFPRKRPYVVLEQINVLADPLKDHSFPSGHTTAIFSIIVPFIVLNPLLATILLPIGMVVGISRIFLGLHYPSDVLIGMLLGSSTGLVSILLIQSLFPYVFG